MVITGDVRTELIERLKNEDLVTMPMPEADYLELAKDFPFKIEYYQSEIYSMCFATTTHEAIAMMIGAILSNLYMENDEYVVLGSNAGVQVPKFEKDFFMPDITVVKGDLAFKSGSKSIITNPYIVVEILSDSTSKFDTESKLPEYKMLESVQQVIFIQQKKVGISSFTRSEQPNVWINHELTEFEQNFIIDGHDVSVASIYKKVKFQS